MSHTVAVFVNGSRVEVPDGASVLDAVRLADSSEADGIERGRRAVTDSRGLPVLPGQRVFAGAIFRVVSARAPSPDPDS